MVLMDDGLYPRDGKRSQSFSIITKSPSESQGVPKEQLLGRRRVWVRAQGWLQKEGGVCDSWL